MDKRGDIISFCAKLEHEIFCRVIELETKFDAGDNVSPMEKLGNIAEEARTSYQCSWKHNMLSLLLDVLLKLVTARPGCKLLGLVDPGKIR